MDAQVLGGLEALVVDGSALVVQHAACRSEGDTPELQVSPGFPGGVTLPTLGSLTKQGFFVGDEQMQIWRFQLPFPVEGLHSGQAASQLNQDLLRPGPGAHPSLGSFTQALSCSIAEASLTLSLPVEAAVSSLFLDK